jgi:hypothetical protein
MTDMKQSKALSDLRHALTHYLTGKSLPRAKILPFAEGFLALPKDIILFIEFFLCREDWRNLLNASKRFRFIFRETRFLELNRWSSIKFFHQVQFQNYILHDCISNPSKQLALNYENNLNISNDFFQSFLSQNLQLSKLTLKNCVKLVHLNIFNCVKHLIIENCINLETISFEETSLTKLELYSCAKVRDLSNFLAVPSLTLMDISPKANYSMLAGCPFESLRLGNTAPVVIPPPVIPSNDYYSSYYLQSEEQSQPDEELENNEVVPFDSRPNSGTGDHLFLPAVSTFRQVRSLDLSNCRGFRNVSPLKFLFSLNLSNCFQIKNVSALGLVHTLNLSNCYQIEDISQLGAGNKIIDLSGCYLIKKVDSLKNCEEIHLANCLSVTDVSSLKNVKKLNLTGCLSITEVNMLSNVEDLNLSENMQITDISGLGTTEGKNHRLNFSYCKNIHSFQSLVKVHSLNLSYCNNNIIYESYYSNLKNNIPELIVSEDYHKFLQCIPHQQRGFLFQQQAQQQQFSPPTKMKLGLNLLKIASFPFKMKSSTPSTTSSSSTTSPTSSRPSTPRSGRNSSSISLRSIRRQKIRIYAADPGREQDSELSITLPQYSSLLSTTGNA